MINEIKRVIYNKEVKNAGWLIAGKIVQIIVGFIISIFTARYLGPSNYGVINYAGAYVAFFTAFCTLGINSVIIKDFVENPDDEGKSVGTSIILRAISSLLSSIMIVGIVSIVDKGERETIIVSALCSFALVFQAFDTINYWFQAKYKSKVTAIATLIAYTITALYRVVLLVTQMSVVWFALASAIDYMIVAIVLLEVYKCKKGPVFSFSWNKGKSLLKSSYHYILSGMMVAIYGRTDILMLKHMLDESAVGYYSLACTINGMWVFVLQAIIDSMYPTIISLYQSGDKRAFERKNKQLYSIIIYISVVVAILFIVFGEFAIVLVYGKEYAPAANPLKVVTWYTIFSYLGVARNAWIVCTNNQKYLKYMYFGAAIMNVILNLIFIPIWGMVGAASASLCTQILTSMILPLFFKPMRANLRLIIDAFLFRYK